MKNIRLGLCWLIAGLWLPVYAASSITSYTVTVPAFNEIHATGHLNVVILGSRAASFQPRVSVKAMSTQRPQVRVSHAILYLAGSAFFSNSTVTVRAPDLRRLVVAGSVHVTGTLQLSHALNIAAAGSGTVVLNGIIPLHRVQQSGDSMVHVRWVNSDTLSVEGRGHSRMELAGVAQQLYARLQDHAVLHAQYLRTEKVQVQTKNHAVAHVCPIDALRAFALENSRIYYYKFPIDLLRYTDQSGSVLQMAWYE